jgi:hypothetical protein
LSKNKTNQIRNVKKINSYFGCGEIYNMRVLILTHPRSGGMSIMKFISHELNYEFYHEPFFGNGDGMSDEDINTKLLVDDNIVVKDFPFRIEERGYKLLDVISKFDKVIIHNRGNHRDVAISLAYFEVTNNGNKMHVPYKVDDEWIKENESEIEKMMDVTKIMFYTIQNISTNGRLKTTYDGLFNDKSDVDKLLKFLKIVDPRYLDILHNRHRLQNGDIGMDHVNIKPKLI